MNNFRFYLYSVLSLLGMMILFGYFLIRKRRKALSIEGEKKSFFEYSWVHLPLNDPLKPHLPVHYRLEGNPNKPLIILIHGLGANLNCWRRLIPLLKKDFHVLAFDLPGFGLTPNPERFFGGHPEHLADLVVKLMEQLNLKGPAYLVGNSLGGILSLSLMEKYEQNFQKALLINPALSRKLVKMKLYQFSWLAGPLARVLNRGALVWLYERTVSKPEILEPEVVDHLARNYVKNPEGLRSFAGYIRLIEVQKVPDLDYSNCLFLFSRGDRVVTAPHQERIQRLFPHAKTLFHPSGGHQFQEDEPEWLTDQLKGFFLSS